jgi:dipeptidyl-peptidase-4
MKHPLRRIPALACLLLTALPALCDPAPLTLERLYSLPWLSGTAPEAPTWSPDSQRVAFLWNDDGGNFRDVWLARVAGGAPVRVTTMPRPPLATASRDDVEALAANARAETDPGVTSLAWTGDGRWLVYAFRGHAYRVEPGSAPRLLETGPGGVSEVHAAPTGSRVAYLARGALMLGDAAAEPPAPRTLHDPATADVEVESLVWSPDGSRIAFVEVDWRRVATRLLPDYLAEETRVESVRRAFPGEPSEGRRLGIVDLRDGHVRFVDLGADPEDQVFAVAWSPDGRSLAVDKSDVYIKDRRILHVDAASLATRELVREQESENVTAEWWTDWAPDGRGIYFTSDRGSDYHVWYAPLSGGPARAITSGDGAVFSASVSAAAHALFVVANPERPEDRHVLRVPLAGGRPLPVTRGHGYHEPTVSPDGRWVADLHSDDVTPPELYLLASDGRGEARRVTHSPPEEFTHHRWVAARYVHFPSVVDGVPLEARLTLPPDFDPTRRYPAIIGSTYSNTVHNRWGGRVYHPTWGLDQLLAQSGYVVMNVDIRGSSGHGKAFRRRLREDYGGIDVDDLYSGARWLAEQGHVDARRIGIWGSSYGGLLTTMSLMRYPGVYAAGVAGAPATSLWHAETGEMRTMMGPRERAERYASASPFLRSGQLQDPLLLIHGMRDDTVLFKDTMTLTERLILQGRDVDVVVLPDAPHGWDTRGLAQTRFAFGKLLAFFRRHLGEGPSP